jgi:CheY-like chemotaxis protein
VLIAQVRRMGAKPSTAATIDEAVGLVMSPTCTINLILVDLGGNEEALIRAVPKLRRLPLIALSTIGAHGDAARMHEAGFTGHVSKPVSDATLAGVMAMCLSRREGMPLATTHLLRESQSPAQPDAAPPGLRILLAEDNEVNRITTTAMLGLFGITTDTACDGQEAVAMSGTTRYDLILMDCQMPIMDGFSATQEIRKRDVSGPRIPIIAVTADALPEDLERCLEAGMDDHLAKPFLMGGLQAKLKLWLPAMSDNQT